MISKETRLKMREAKLKNPCRYWLGKKRPNMVGNTMGFKEGNKPWNFGKRVVIICANCKSKYSVILARKDKSRFCSKKCLYQFEEKEWGAWSNKGRRFNLKWWRDLRAKVITRDVVCQHCHRNGGRMCIHHIVPYRVKHDNSLENLITLCGRCHRYEELAYLERINYV